MPLEIAKISLQLDIAKRFNNDMFQAMGAVLKERGVGGFAIGYTGVQLRQSLWTGGYFATLSFFEDQITRFFDITNIPTVCLCALFLLLLYIFVELISCNEMIKVI